MLNINELLVSLSGKRPIFHSEADFQHAMAWEIHEKFPESNIRLELPVHINNRDLHVDLWIKNQDMFFAIELKYKTRGLSINLRNEHFYLKNQSAQDIGRYDFLHDIERLELVSSEIKDVIPFAIILTNDSAYWSNQGIKNTVDSDFRLYNGRNLTGQLKWGSQASEGTKKNREQPITLRHNYHVSWKRFSQLNTYNYGEFKFLILTSYPEFNPLIEI